MTSDNGAGRHRAQLDPDAAAVIAARPAGPSMRERGVQASREMMEAIPRQPLPEMAEVTDLTVDGPHGPLTVRVYRPHVPGDLLPAMVYFHGGGYVLGGLASYDQMARSLAAATGCVVVNVDYRLAPEHTYPVATDEAYAATCWTVANAERLRIDPARVGVGGDSAGGTLAAGVALQARDQGRPSLAFQLLMYPGVDGDLSRPSVTEFADGPVLNAADIPWMRGMYLGEDPAGHTAYGVPALASDLRGLPQAIVVTAELDPIRDGGEAYGARLRDAGVQTALLRYPGVYHGFLMQESIARTRLAVVEIGALLQAKLAHLAAARPEDAGVTPTPAYLTPGYVQAPAGSGRP